MKFNFAFRGKVEEDGIPKLKKKKKGAVTIQK